MSSVIGNHWTRLPLIDKGLVLGSLLMLLAQVAMVALRREYYQYDFRSVYLAEQLLHAGKDPYSFAAARELASTLGFAENVHPFLYPPHALVVYAPLEWLSAPVAYYGWLALNLFCVAFLYHALTSRFCLRAGLVAPLLALGLNGSVASCLRAGQLSLITAACVTLAALALARGHSVRAGAAIFLGGIVKLQPLPLLILLGLPRDRRGFFAAAAFVALVLLVLLLDMQVAPQHWASFRDAMPLVIKAAGGPENGSSLNLLQNLFQCFSIPPTHGAVHAAYGALVLALVALGLFTCRATLLAARDPLLTSFSVALLTWQLCLPRVMIYEWVIALPSAAHLLSRVEPKWAASVSCGLLFLPGLYLRRYALGLDTYVPAANLLDVLLGFVSWLACFTVLVTFAVQAMRRRESVPTSG